jgi:hypothetical protein
MDRNSSGKQTPKFPLIVSATHGDAVAINTVDDPDSSNVIKTHC